MARETDIGAAGAGRSLAGWLDANARFFTTPRTALGFLGGFFLVMLLLQLWVQNGGRTDDSEQILLAQSWALGYDPRNPPLFTWLTWLSFEILGPGYAPLRLLVVCILFATYVFLYLAARLAIAERRLAVLAALGPTALLYFHWYPFKSFSHTLLLSLFCAATLWAVLRLFERRGPADYALLGVAVAGGLLSKYNFSLFLAALVAAALLTPGLRRALLAPWALLSLAVALALAAPHYLWLWANRGEAGALLDRKWGLGQAEGYLEGVASGLLALFGSTASFLLPMVALVPLVFWRAFLRRPPADRPLAEPARFVILAHVALLALLVGCVLVLQANRFANHHLFVFIGTSLALFAWIERAGSGPWPIRLFALAPPLLSLAVAVALPINIISMPSRSGKLGPLLPYESYAEGLRAAGFERGTVAVLGSMHFFPASHLRGWFPDARFLRPVDSVKHGWAPPANRAPGDCAIVWSKTHHPELEERLRRAGIYRDQAPDRVWLPPPPEGAVWGSVGGELRWSGRPALEMAYVVIPGGWQACR